MMAAIREGLGSMNPNRNRVRTVGSPSSRDTA